MKQSVIRAIGYHLNIEQSKMIKSSGYTITISKTENLFNSQLVYEGFSKLYLPSFCNLISTTKNYQTCLNYENITMAVKLIRKLNKLYYKIKFIDCFNTNGILSA